MRPHRGFTENFTAPGGPHLGHHHLPPIPRCRHHTPGAYPLPRSSRAPTAHHRNQRCAPVCGTSRGAVTYEATTTQHACVTKVPEALRADEAGATQAAKKKSARVCTSLHESARAENRSTTRQLGFFTALGPAPGAPHLGHHGRGRGPTCGDHGDAPVRPHPPHVRASLLST